MSTTGIVRRIDDLGRIVIPKEIRKTLRIKEGESLEIEVVNDNIVLKKYSSIEDIKGLLNTLIMAIYKVINKSIIVFDRDRIICGIGGLSSNLINKNITDSLYDLMVSRKSNYLGRDIFLVSLFKTQGNYIFSSIIPNGDVVGGVLIIGEEEINDNDQLFLNLIVDIFTKSLEE